MGSIGVSTGSLSPQQLGDMLEGSLTNARRKTSIVVFPNADDKIMTDRARGRYRGFKIDMKGASAEEREAFLKRLRGKENTSHRNSEASARKAAEQARKNGWSEREQKIAAEMQRTATQRKAIQSLLDKNKKKFKNIKLKSLTNADYKRHNKP